jgi:hypothetical protein
MWEIPRLLRDFPSAGGAVGKSQGWTFPPFPRRGISTGNPSQASLWLLCRAVRFAYAVRHDDQEKDWTVILGWLGYRVYQHQINEKAKKAKKLKLWVRRKSANQKLVCGGCGRRVHDIREICEREVRDLPWGEYAVTVVIERSMMPWSLE